MDSMSLFHEYDPSTLPTAPTSPDNLLFYSAPTSPMPRINASYESNPEDEDDDDFEFETSCRFANGFKCESSPGFECSHIPLGIHHLDCQLQRSNSIFSTSAMAFADELFSNGCVLPLKLPPRLRDTQQASVPSSPNKSPSSVLRIPFGGRSTWNDNFDPFMVALDKVSDETRGRKSIHRRSRSHSPFRTIRAPPPPPPMQDQQKQLRVDANIYDHHQMVEAKGSAYARWVRSQTMGHKRSSSALIGASPKAKGLTKAKTSLFGKSGRVGDGGLVIRKSGHEIERGSFSTETKMQRVKSLLLKYTSFGKDNNQSAAAAATMRKPSNYFKKLSFKFKGGIHEKNKASTGESKITSLVKYNPKLPLCLGYVPASPTHI